MYTHSCKRSALLLAMLRVLAACMIVLALLPYAAAQAQDENPPTNEVTPERVAQQAQTTFRIVLNAGEVINPDQIPAGMSAIQSRQVAKDLVAQYARPVLDELGKLQSHGRVTSFRSDLDTGTILVLGDASAFSHVNLSDDLQKRINSLAPESTEVPNCAAEAIKALPEQVQGISTSRVKGEASDAVTAEMVHGDYITDPTGKIEIYLPGDGYSSVRGKVSANAAVKMTITRGGVTIVTQQTNSYSDGYYYFYPDWYSCPTSGYSWEVKPGDVVSVVVNGVVYRTTAIKVSGRVNPVTNIIAGGTLPNRKITALIMQPIYNNPCSWVGTLRSAVSDAAGKFSITYGEFDGRAYAYVHARDAAGNSTYIQPHAYQVYLPENYKNEVQGTAAPNSTVTVKHYRGATLLDTTTANTSVTGDFWAYVYNQVQTKDVVTVTGVEVNMRFTAPIYMKIYADPFSNKLSGYASPGYKVAADFVNSDFSFRTACWGGYYACGFATPSSTGLFNIALNVDIAQADYAYVSIYDTAGNVYSGSRLPTLALAINRGYNQITGSWPVKNALLTVKHYRGTALLSTVQIETDSYDGYYGLSYPVPAEMLKVNDIITVTDGTRTLKSPVRSMSARLPAGTSKLVGSAPAGRMIARMYDYRPTEGYMYGYCQAVAAVNGAYSLAFPATFTGRDWAMVSVSDAAGYYTLMPADSFSINTSIGFLGVWGYSEVPSAVVSITHKRGATTIGTFTVNSYPDGWYSSNTKYATKAGDVFAVKVGTVTRTLTVPALTVLKDVARNRVYGTAPANGLVIVYLSRYYNQDFYSSSIGTLVQANSVKAYSQSYNGFYFGYQCSAANVGDACTRAETDFYTANGYGVYTYTPWPQAVGPDAYESDNTSSEAKAYTAPQKHTFTNNGGASDEDWVYIDITDADLNHPITFTVSGLGWYMYVYTTLYEPDATSILATQYLSEYGTQPSFEYTFTQAGRYYLKFNGLDSYSFGACDSKYTLTITK